MQLSIVSFNKNKMEENMKVSIMYLKAHPYNLKYQMKSMHTHATYI